MRIVTFSAAVSRSVGSARPCWVPAITVVIGTIPFKVVLGSIPPANLGLKLVPYR